MTSSVRDRHHVVNEQVRPARTPAGDAFTDLVLEVAWLGGLFTAAGESLARLGGQTLARWVILDAVEDQPMTVADIARRRGIARQAVQRVADLLAHEGLAAYEPNPQHRRAKLLGPTPSGRAALRSISIAQKAWADALGATFGEDTLRTTGGIIHEIRRTLMAQDLLGRATANTAPGG